MTFHQQIWSWLWLFVLDGLHMHNRDSARCLVQI